jgi:pyruvate kinase
MAEEMLEQLGFVQPRQIVGIVAGTRTKSGATNFMRLHMVGDRHIEAQSGKAQKGKAPDAKSKTKADKLKADASSKTRKNKNR